MLESSVYTREKPQSQVGMTSSNSIMTIAMRFSKNTPLYKTDDQISQGMCSRLFKYAYNRLKENGMNECLSWEANISTSDGDSKPADRSYCVGFKNNEGLEISVVGIYTKNGWPFLDHGLDIQINQ